MSKVKVSQSVSQSVTRSPIELLWTAKNNPSPKPQNQKLNDKTTVAITKVGCLHSTAPASRAPFYFTAFSLQVEESFKTADVALCRGARI